MDAGTADRMQKFRIEIFDNEHNSVWNREIKKTPKPSHAEQLDSTNQLAVVPFPDRDRMAGTNSERPSIPSQDKS